MSATEPINILIVDDNKNNRFTLRSLINEHFETHIFEAQSGETALKILLKQKINLIILDVQMPDMDGFETAQFIRSHRKTQHIPIVFLTAAYRTEEFRKKGFALGAADYLTKPIDAAQLLSRIQSYIRFLEQEQQYKQELECKVQERTAKLLAANKLLEQEVTERKKIETQLSHAKEVAEDANRAKSYFLANMSHELRTPLNAIIGYSEMLEEFAGDVSQEDFIPDLRRIRAAGKHLLDLINGVLDLSKIEAGKMTVFLESFELKAFLDEVVDTVQPLLEKKANVFQVEYFCLPDKIHTDRTKLRQMLLNLISNANKFSEQSVILLQVSCDPRRGGEEISFCVTDDGIGITEEQKSRLFQPFTQADASTTRRFGGTGLGLTITKQFAEMLGGGIRVSSEFGYGSTFSLRLPTHAKEPEPTYIAVVEETCTGADKIVLVLSEDKVQCEQLKTQLSPFGYSIALATNDEDSIKIVRKLRPDVIILSVQTSLGWNLVAQLKNDPFLTLIPTLLIMTDNLRGYATYAMDCIAKPLRHEQLTTVLERYTQHLTPLIKVVDNNSEDTQHTMTTFFKNKKWPISFVTREQILSEPLENEELILIFADLSNAMLDGIKYIKQMKKNISVIHIIIMSDKPLTANNYAQLNQFSETCLTQEGCLLTEFSSYLNKLLMLFPKKITC